MAIVINMPRLSDTMEEGVVAKWLKKVGDNIAEGDILAEIETDKATMEFESFNEGVLLHIGVEEGETAPVDSLLAIIGEQEEDFSALLKNDASLPTENGQNSTEDSNKEVVVFNSEEKTEVTTTPNASTLKGRIFASPLAKKMAKEKGISLTEVKGSGENGRIVKKDIESHTTSKATQSLTLTEKVPVTNFTANQEEHTTELKNSQMRKIIAKRLKESKFTAPHYYLTIEVMMDNTIDSRNIINAIPETKISFNDIVVKACAMALKKHPQVNTSWNDKTTKWHSHIHIGVAVATDEGLLVPVLPFTDQMSLSQINQKIRVLATKARNKKLTPDEMEGSTFTISNLGMFGIEDFTSIINQPNSAILSVGAIVQKPIVKDGQIIVGNTMKVTLACDHRTVDGVMGAKFLQTLKTFLENPVTILV